MIVALIIRSRPGKDRRPDNSRRVIYLHAWRGGGGSCRVDFIQNIDLAAVFIQFAVLIFSLSIHEAAHAWTADRLGDGTARGLGRISLNPVRHVDPIGTLLFPILQIAAGVPVIGWAKPVPVNPTRLRNPRVDQMGISLAGPGSNLLTAAIALAVLVLLKIGSADAGALITNMAVTMSIPRGQGVMAMVVGLLVYLMVVNLALALFNMIPIPPLDGHWLLYGLLPDSAGKLLARAGAFGILILYGLMFLGIFRYLFVPIYWILEALIDI